MGQARRDPLNAIRPDSEAVLYESEARTRAILEAAVDAIITIDEHGIIESWNQAATRMFGFPEEEALGQNVKILMPEPCRSEHDSHIAGYRATGQKRIIGIGREVRARRKDGSTFPVHLAVSELRLGNRRLFTGIARDITELQSAIQRLHDSEARTRAILETAVDAIITIDETGAIESLNPAAERLFGYAADELTGRNVKLLMPSPYREEHDAYLGNYLGSGTKKIIGIGREVLGLRKDGTTFPIELAVSEVRLGGRRFFTGMVRDISERKRAEAQLRESNVELARSNQELDDFAYIASHDLKEPLRGIHNYSTFLIEDFADRLGEAGRSKLETLKRLAQRMETLIDSLLEFSRVGRLEFAMQPTDLNPVLAEALEALRVSLEESKVQVRVPRPLPVLECDRVRAGEVFHNLVSNAIKYNDKEEKWVEIGWVEGDPAAGRPPVFHVRDNGIGIRSRHRESIFRIFKRLHAREHFGGGTGAGLTIVKKIVERHGGRIWLESVYGEGSTFHFTLKGGRSEDGATAAVSSGRG
jgi:two-component system, LuxR family, sensor kinase FixL